MTLFSRAVLLPGFSFCLCIFSHLCHRPHLCPYRCFWSPVFSSTFSCAFATLLSARNPCPAFGPLALLCFLSSSPLCRLLFCFRFRRCLATATSGWDLPPFLRCRCFCLLSFCTTQVFAFRRSRFCTASRCVRFGHAGSPLRPLSLFVVRF